MKAIGVEDILGYQVINDGIYSCVNSIANWIENGDKCRWLACINPHSYFISSSDNTFSSALHDADWLIPDGVGIVLASYLLNGRIRKRVTGSDIFWHVHEHLNREGGASLFFLGATEETLERVRGRISRDFTNLRIAGTYSPPFKAVLSEEDTERMLAAVNATAPDVLWVSMTSPKQDLWIHQNRMRINVRFAAAVGAAFDFYSGRVKRSHPIFQRSGLEWLPRLIQEPRRLWQRMFISAPVFLFAVLRERLLRR